MNVLTRGALERAGLLAACERRMRGEPLTQGELARFAAADLLVLGAAADCVRAADAGSDVLLSTRPRASRVIGPDEPRRGTELCRHVALLRLAGSAGIAVDVAAVGLPVALVLLGFGATELAGALGRGSRSEAEPAESPGGSGGTAPHRLPIADAPEAERRKELAGRVTRAKRVPVFADGAETQTPVNPQLLEGSP